MKQVRKREENDDEGEEEVFVSIVSVHDLNGLKEEEKTTNRDTNKAKQSRRRNGRRKMRRKRTMTMENKTLSFELRFVHDLNCLKTRKQGAEKETETSMGMHSAFRYSVCGFELANESAM